MQRKFCIQIANSIECFEIWQILQERGNRWIEYLRVLTQNGVICRKRQLKASRKYSQVEKLVRQMLQRQKHLSPQKKRIKQKRINSQVEQNLFVTIQNDSKKKEDTLN